MKKTYLLLLLPIWPFWLIGQGFVTQYRSYTITDGSPHPSLNYLLQDQRGFIWVAGLNGIARYDGYEFKNYHPAGASDSLTPPRDFPILYESTQGQVWLGYTLSKDKLFRYDYQRDTFLGIGASQIDQSVRAIWQDQPTELWLGTGAKGLWQLDLTAPADTIPYRQFRHEPEDWQSLPTDYMASGMWRDDLNQLWILTESGLSCKPAGAEDFTTYTWSDTAVENEGLYFWPDTTRQCFWIGSFVGLVRFNWEDESYERYTLFSQKGEKEPLVVFSPVVDRNGKVWVSIGGYPDSFLWVFDPETDRFEQVFSEQSGARLPLPGANRLAVDRNGGIWSAGFSRGLQRVQDQRRNVFRLGLPPTEKAFDDEGIKAMVEDQEGTIWLATEEQGVWRWRPEEQLLEQIILPLADQPVLDLLLSEDSRQLWIYTHFFLLRMNTSTLSWEKIAPFSEQTSYSRYYRGVEWQGGWLGSCFGYGLYQVDREASGKVKRFLAEEDNTDPPWGSLPVRNIISVAVGKEEEELWFGTTYQGLYGWKEKEQKITEHLADTQIKEILPTPDGLLWLSTTKGLLCYDPEQGTTLTSPTWPRDRLKFIMGMIADEEGLLWVVDEKGIIAIASDSKKVIHEFSASTWLMEGEDWYEERTSCLRTRSGRLLFANSNGLFAMHPSTITYDTVPPQVSLDSWWVGKEKRALPAGHLLADRLAYQENDLTFKVAVLHYKLPEENRLFYRLKNFDTDWRKAVPGQLLEYPNLAPGEYELLVSGSNSDGFVGAEESLLRFQIVPAWYASTSAYVVYMLLLLLGAYAGFRLLWWRKSKEAEQRYWQEMDAAKSTLFTNISHEFRTPLTLILGDATALQEQLSGQAKSPLRRIMRSGQRLLWLVNQLLELARADSGFLRLELQQADIVIFLRQHLNAFHSLAAARQIELRFSTKTPTLMSDFDPERLQRVISNLLHNAIKFSEQGGEVSMSLSVKESAGTPALVCRITDQGPGIAAGEIPRIFDRFYRVNAQAGGSGIGLALTKELVLLMNGEIGVESTPDQGSTFQLTLPITQQAPVGQGNWETEHAFPVMTEMEEATPKSGKIHRTQVLVIEDNDDLRAFLQTCLSDYYQLTLARDGQEGLDLAFDQPFDLIVSDVMMPRLDGYTVCQSLKASLSTSHIPVILLTARVDKASRLEGIKRGADAYLGKPFDPSELRLVCQQLLRQRKRLRAYYLEMIRTGKLSDRILTPEEKAEMAFIVAAREAVVQHLEEEDFGVEQLAQALNISRSNLHRKLQQMLSLSSSRFIRSVRISEAQELFKDASLSISQVAYAVGFKDPDYFSKVFKEECGVSPSVYRKNSVTVK